MFAAASGRPLYTLETMFPDLLEEIIPVSYTHLVVMTANFFGWKGSTFRMGSLPAAACMASVSYTHLDVYKRQAFSTAAG